MTRWDLAEQILAQQEHYLMVTQLPLGVTGNQPASYEAIDLLFRQPPWPAHPQELLTYQTTDKGHGRIEVRTLESSTALNAYLDWRGVQQVLRRSCRRLVVPTGEVTREQTYGITSLSRAEVSLADVERLWRGHWIIHNSVHYVRDETFGEDRCRLRVGSAGIGGLAQRCAEPVTSSGLVQHG